MKRRVVSARQREVMDFMQRHVVEHGRMPTRREIAAAIGLGDGSLGHISRMLKHVAQFNEIDVLRARVRDLEYRLERAGMAA